MKIYVFRNSSCRLINELPPSSYRTRWFFDSFNFSCRFGCITSLFEQWRKRAFLPYDIRTNAKTNRLVKGTHCCNFVPHIVSISVFHFALRYSTSSVITEKYVRWTWIVGKWEEIGDENACMHFIKHSFVVQDVRNRIPNIESAHELLCLSFVYPPPSSS